MSADSRNLEKKLEQISKVDLRKGVGKAISYVQEAAKLNCGGFKQSTGELRESIFISLKGGGDPVTGICFTNKEYASYVEFGTGPIGQDEHEGISPNIAIAYNQNGWMIPGDAMDREKAEMYGLGVVEKSDGSPMGYLTNGQPAQPFMYPALKDNEEKVIKIMAEQLRRQI